MAKPEWKWLLQRLDDRELVRLARSLRVRLPGFRGTRWERHLPDVRPRVVQALLQTKMLSRVRQTLDERVKRDARLLAVRRLTEAELREELQKTTEPEQLILALVTSSDQSVRQRAERLFEFMGQSGSLADWLTTPIAAVAVPPGLRGELEELKKAEATWQAERAALVARIASLESEIAALRAGAERSYYLFEAERQGLLSRLADRETKLQQKQQQLHALGQGAKSELNPPEPALPAVAAESASGEFHLLVGNINLAEIDLGKQRKLRHLLPQDAAIAADQLALATLVLMLTSATPLPIQRLVRRAAGERLRCFTAYDQLLTFLEQGEESDA